MLKTENITTKANKINGLEIMHRYNVLITDKLSM
jgi:hypothetical protein